MPLPFALLARRVDSRHTLWLTQHVFFWSKYPPVLGGPMPSMRRRKRGFSKLHSQAFSELHAVMSLTASAGDDTLTRYKGKSAISRSLLRLLFRPYRPGSGQGTLIWLSRPSTAFCTVSSTGSQSVAALAPRRSTANVSPPLVR